MASNIRIIFVVLVLFSIYSSSHAVPLSAKSRWIIDDKTGKRVKLVCANLVAHTESMLPEGVSKQPVKDIVRLTRMMGFNCIRLTYAAYMFTQFHDVIVAENLEQLGLHNAVTGIAKHNPHLLGLNLVDAQKAVVDEFSSQGIMLVLDNQVSKPMWCCADNDGNGFFGDKYFDPNDWLNSLKIVANLYKDNPMVIAMSLRNEIRGPSQNEDDWYEYIEKGARAIHQVNPNVLVIVSGLSYAIRLEFLKERPLHLNFMRNKLMYETHRYAFSDGNGKLFQNQPSLNRVCQSITDGVEDQVGFLSRGKNAAPIFVSEWGLNQEENVISDNTFFVCFLSYLAERDYEWSLWALQGSYMFRQGLQDPGELYGMFNSDWNGHRNADVSSRLQFVQQTLQDPVSTVTPYHIIFHPLSGKCLRVDDGKMHFSECYGMARWNHVQHNKTASLQLIGSGGGGCLTAVGDGQPVALTQDCTSLKSSWKKFQKYQLAYTGDQGEQMCLEWDLSYSLQIVTKKCIVESDGTNPQRQWFNLIRSNAA